MADYAIVNLRELENMSVKYGHGEDMEARFASRPLELEKMGMSLQKVLPGRTIPFKHKHAEQEEIHIITAGAGFFILGDEKVEVKAWDAVRVPPEVIRTVEAGPEGLEMIIVGAPFTGKNDFEVVRE